MTSKTNDPLGQLEDRPRELATHKPIEGEAGVYDIWYGAKEKGDVVAIQCYYNATLEDYEALGEHKISDARFLMSIEDWDQIVEVVEGAREHINRERQTRVDGVSGGGQR